MVSALLVRRRRPARITLVSAVRVSVTVALNRSAVVAPRAAARSRLVTVCVQSTAAFRKPVLTSRTAVASDTPTGAAGRSVAIAYRRRPATMLVRRAVVRPHSARVALRAATVAAAVASDATTMLAASPKQKRRSAVPQPVALSVMAAVVRSAVVCALQAHVLRRSAQVLAVKVRPVLVPRVRRVVIIRHPSI